MQLLKPSWVNHDGDKAIFGVDIHPDGSRFATGGQGQDSSGRVVIWNMLPVVSEKAELNDKVPKLLCQLDQHLGCVNSVRWSNSGDYLASAGDDKVIIIWQKSDYGGGSVFGSNVVNVESWRIVTTLRGHAGDILDVAWSPQDFWLASASVDNNVIVWNATKWPEQVRILRGHTGFVKGVSWDPIGRYLASQADDKSMRVWRTSSWTTEQTITEPFVECGGTTTILRPSWSPDGQYLVSAHAMNNGGPTAQIIERDGWSTDKDFVGHRKAITCVRFNPNILSSKDNKQAKLVQYCCVAIGSRDRSVSIWFTSLKRPLVVIHDIFEDSILDLSWSKCGSYLMAVSKDGSLGFISFSEAEIGRALTEEQTMKSHMKMYGTADLGGAAVAPTIIENPELLKLQEERKKKEKDTLAKNMDEKRSRLPSGPTNKQIEMRTADGRRRITPMFIPPPTKGDSNSRADGEESFSSSRTEKSKIVVERVEGIVEPNVSSPNKCSKSSNDSETPRSARKIAADLTDSPVVASSNKAELPQDIAADKVVSTIAVKRKLDEPVVSAKKKKTRGRTAPFSYEKDKMDVAPPPSVVSRQSSPTFPDRQPQATPHSASVLSSRAVRKDVLPPSSLPRVSQIELPYPSSDAGGKSIVLYERDWKLSDKVCPGLAGRLPNLHRVSRWDSGKSLWSTYIHSEAVAFSLAKLGIILASIDGSLHVLSCQDGEHIFPPIQLNGRPSQLLIEENHVMTLTTCGELTVWDLDATKRLLRESVRHLVESRGAVKSVHFLKGKEGEGEGGEKTPVLVLRSGEAFGWFWGLGSWVQLGESSGVRRFVNPDFSLVQPANQSALGSPLSTILAASGTYASSCRLSVSSVSGDVSRSLTESFIKRMMTSSRHIASPLDFRLWHKRLAKHYIVQGDEKELRKLFDDLLGPITASTAERRHSPDAAMQTWEPKLMGISKRELLKEYLKEILLSENSIQWQRLHSEFSEQLNGADAEYAI